MKDNTQKMLQMLPARKTCTHSRGGFTIVEVLIALALFSVAVVGVITIAAQGGIDTSFAKNRLIATYLADEGIELMRGMRDTAVLQARGSSLPSRTGWNNFVVASSSSCSAGSPCDIDATNGAGVEPFQQSSNFASCSTTVSGVGGFYCPLYYDSTLSSSGFYSDRPTFRGEMPTIFSRALIVKSSSTEPDDVSISSTVVWQEGASTQSITQTEYLFDWYPS